MAEIAHILVSCEHGSNRVPARYRQLFTGQDEALASHRGYDPGALHLARAIAKAFGADLYFSTITRLLIELNRSVHNHRSIFSSSSRQLPASEKRHILQQYYLPYRRRLEQHLSELVAEAKPVLHLSVHSFTPELNGKIRTADIGLLYDPARQFEKVFCHNWRRTLNATGAVGAIKMNYPYFGTSDGFTTYLRTVFNDSCYMGVELEVNQKLIGKGGAFPSEITNALIRSLQPALALEV